jgi:serine/threonine protein kinase
MLSVRNPSEIVRGADLGSGDYGRSYTAFESQSTTISYRLKSIHPNPAFDNSPDDLLRELRLLASIASPFLSHPVGLVRINSESAILTKYYSNGSLANLAASQSWSYQEQIHLLFAIASGMKSLHQDGICHGNLKPENILVNEQRRAMIADYGYYRFASQAKMDSNTVSVFQAP